MIKIDRAIVVEGKYDKITLENIVDALIIPTDGFRIFKDKEKCALLRTLSKKCGLAVLTDSDSAGAVIRSHLKQICGDGDIINVYVPQISGKERRKDKPSKEGFLGVEGLKTEVLLEAFKRSGVIAENTEKKRRRFTKTDLFLLGLSGGENSAVKRESLLKHLNMPTNISANAFLDLVNTLYDYEEFKGMVKKWEQEADKR